MKSAPQSAPSSSAPWRDIPTLLLGACIVLGVFGLIRSKLLAELLWQPQLVSQTKLLFAGVASMAVAACWVARFYSRRPEPLLVALLVAIAGTLCGPAATSIILLFLLSSYCLGTISLRCFRNSNSPTNILVELVTGWAIYAMLFTLAAGLPVNMAATHTLVLTLPILMAMALPAIRNDFLSLLSKATQRSEDTVRSSLTDNAGLVVCVTIFSLHLALVALPDRFYDAMVTHLYIPSFVAAHRAWNFDASTYVFAFMPNAADMLYADMYILGGETAARLQNFCAFLFSAGAAYQIILRICSRTVAVWTVALLISIPLTFIETATLFVENTLTLLVTTSTLAIVDARLRIDLRHYSAIMILIAAAAMVKLHGAVAAVAIGSLAMVLYLRAQGGARNRVAFAGITFVTANIALWPYYFSWWKTGNPLFPLFNHIFKSPYFPPTEFLDTRWTGKMSFSYLYDTTFSTSNFVEGYNGAFGFTLFTFLAAGLAAALIRRNTVALLCGALGFFLFLALALKIQYLRYLLILVPLLMVLVAFGIEHIRQIRWMKIPLACAIAVVVSLNVYKMPAGGWVLGVSDLRACCSQAARRQLEVEQVPERVINRVVNEQEGPTSQVLYISSPFGALLSGRAIYSNWYNSTYSADFAAVASEQDLDRLLGRIMPTHVVVNHPASTQLEKISEAYLQSKGRLITRIGRVDLYELPRRS